MKNTDKNSGVINPLDLKTESGISVALDKDNNLCVGAAPGYKVVKKYDELENVGSAVYHKKDIKISQIKTNILEAIEKAEEETPFRIKNIEVSKEAIIDLVDDATSIKPQRKLKIRFYDEVW